MAAFDANQMAPPPLNNEKSAFDEDDGDLGSDIDGDAPQIGGINS